MKEANIVIVDEDVEFLRRLDGYLREKLSFPVRIQGYSDVSAFLERSDRREPEAALISEKVFYRLSLDGLPRVILLLEGIDTEGAEIVADSPDPVQNRLRQDRTGRKGAGDDPERVIRRVNKYRALRRLVKEVSQMVMEAPGFTGTTREESEARAVLIGFFTPVSHCLQTTGALTLGQLTAARKKTLYLNLEPFHGLPQGIFDPGEEGDLTELLYYFECEPEGLPIQLERMTQTVGALHVIRPAGSYTALAEVGPDQWRSFFQALSTKTELEVIICDLSVCVPGLPDLLREFDRIYTIGRDDPISAQKLANYERMLRRTGHEDLSTRTRQLTLPMISRLPADPARYGEGELADFFRALIAEEGDLLSAGHGQMRG